MMSMIPTLPPEAAAAEAHREEARRQAEAQAGSGVDGLADAAEVTVDLAASGVLDVAGQVAGACLEGVATVAKASLDVVGGILSGLGDL
jgi:hypothetical protein